MNKKNQKQIVSTKKELEEEIARAILKSGMNANLNYIDISNITDLSSLFSGSYFNGDISKRDLSKAKFYSYKQLLFYKERMQRYSF